MASQNAFKVLAGHLARANDSIETWSGSVSQATDPRTLERAEGLLAGQKERAEMLTSLIKEISDADLESECQALADLVVGPDLYADEPTMTVVIDRRTHIEDGVERYVVPQTHAGVQCSIVHEGAGARHFNAVHGPK